MKEFQTLLQFSRGRNVAVVSGPPKIEDVIPYYYKR